MKIKAYKTYYLIDNKKYDRVTTVLHFFTPEDLVKWGLKVGKKEHGEITKLAMKIGTRVDKISTAIMDNKKWAITKKDHPAVRNCVEGFQRWLKEENPVINDYQVTCKDDSLMIAGTRDIRINNYTIVDVKCSGRINLSYWIQIGTYAFLSGLPIKRLGILRLDKLTGDYEYKEIEYTEHLFHLFMGLLNYYRYLNKDKKEKEEVKNNGGDNITTREIEKKLGIFSPKVRNNWTEWHWEI